jgi:hypothetical protein
MPADLARTVDDVRRVAPTAGIVERRVTRFLCPFCRRGHSARKAAERHVVRCFRNPAVGGCKTCAHFSPAERPDLYSSSHNYHEGAPEGCDEGVDLTAGLQRNCAVWCPAGRAGMTREV